MIKTSREGRVSHRGGGRHGLGSGEGIRRDRRVGAPRWPKPIAASDEAAKLTAAGHKVIAVTCDVADAAQVAAMVDRAVAEFSRLMPPYNNAGINSDAGLLGDSAQFTS